MTASARRTVVVRGGHVSVAWKNNGETCTGSDGLGMCPAHKQPAHGGSDPGNGVDGHVQLRTWKATSRTLIFRNLQFLHPGDGQRDGQSNKQGDEGDNTVPMGHGGGHGTESAI